MLFRSRMVIPVGERYEQMLVLLTKRDGELVRELLEPSLFVPMTGAAEGARRVQPDGGRPSIANGGFEEMVEGTRLPAAWYYGRQIELIDASDAPEGGRYLRLENAQPGRPAQVFQGLPVDGRAVRQVSISASIRADGVRPGVTAEEVPSIGIRFYDERRSRSAWVRMAPAATEADRWVGSFAWRQVTATAAVPAWAREGILQIGMMGGTGRVDVDGFALEGEPR